MPDWQRSSAAAAEKSVNDARVEVARVAKVDGSEFFAALVECEQGKIGGGVIQPGHALRRGAPGACRTITFSPPKWRRASAWWRQ